MIIAILQARMSSTRLPGKVLAPILCRPMVLRQVERVGRARRIDRLIAATSTDPSDDVLADTLARAGVLVARGALHDVLGRFSTALAAYGPAEHVVRLTADCPLADPAVIERLIELHLAGDYDYTSNTLTRTYAHGLDCEIVRAELLTEAARLAVDPYEREHVTPHFYRHPERYRIGSLTRDPSIAHMRWTVDWEADLAMVRAVYDGLYATNPAFSTDDILTFCRAHPEVAAINQGVA